MPFNFAEYDQLCSHKSKRELRAEVERHNEIIAEASAGTGLAVLAIPFTLGISAVAIGGTAPIIINAKKKRSIAKKWLNKDTTSEHESSSSSSSTRSSQSSMTAQPVVRRHSIEDSDLPSYHAVPDKSETQLAVNSRSRQLQLYHETLPPTYEEVAELPARVPGEKELS